MTKIGSLAWLKGVVLLGGLILGLATVAVAQKPDSLQLNPDVPMTYTVKKGDTLWGISGMYLKEPWRWPELWDNNPQVDNPHLIYPGDVLSLSWEDGRPRLMVGSRGVVKLSPEVRSQALSTAIPPIPRDQIDPFLRSNRVVDALVFDASAYVIAADAGRLVSGKGDRIYGRGPLVEGTDIYGILREGQIIVDPVTEEILGLTVVDIGTGSLIPGDDDLNEGAVKTFEVTRSTEEVRVEDRLMPQLEGIVDAYFQPKAPDFQVENGFMVAVDGGVTQIGALDIVTLNLGERDGVVVGDVMAIYQSGETVIDPVKGDPVTLPDVRAGMLMVFSVYEKASFALVLTASRPLAVMDKVKNP